MNLRLALTAVCLFGIGLFSKAQSSKPKVENGPDAIPVTVKSTPRKKLPPPPPPPMEARKATAPKKELPPPPPPPKAPKHKD